jgi:hypothetical protein
LININGAGARLASGRCRGIEGTSCSPPADGVRLVTRTCRLARAGGHGAAFREPRPRCRNHETRPANSFLITTAPAGCRRPRRPPARWCRRRPRSLSTCTGTDDRGCRRWQCLRRVCRRSGVLGCHRSQTGQVEDGAGAGGGEMKVGRWDNTRRDVVAIFGPTLLQADRRYSAQSAL